MKNLYDVVIVGGGPAGLTAALYLARAKYRVLVLEKEQFGGQISITHEVVNYPGIAKVSGKHLTDTMQQQAASFGAEFMLAEATDFELSEEIKTVHTNRGDYRCFGILLATGAHPRTVGFKGEEEHKGRGVAYCATCDGEFFTGKEVFVIGGGYAAAEESVFLTKFARHVTVLVRKDDFTCAVSVAEQAKKHEKITVLYNTVMEEVSGENGLTYARYKNTVTGEVAECRSQETFGVFVFVGYVKDFYRRSKRHMKNKNDRSKGISSNQEKVAVILHIKMDTKHQSERNGQKETRAQEILDSSNYGGTNASKSEPEKVSKTA